MSEVGESTPSTRGRAKAASERFNLFPPVAARVGLRRLNAIQPSGLCRVLRAQRAARGSRF